MDVSVSSIARIFFLFLLPTIAMAPSSSKQKRLAEKAAKQAARINANIADPSASSSTPPGSANGGSSLNTPLTSLSAATSQEDLTSMAKLQIATERSFSLNSHILVFFSQYYYHQGARQVCWYRTRRGEISRLMHTLYPFTADYLSRAQRLLLTMARDTVFSGTMVQERCVQMTYTRG